MTFKEHIAADIPATFLNVAEFGEPRSIDGAAAVATVLDDEARSPNGATRSDRTTDGVYVSESVLHVRLEDLEARPVIGQRLDVDGRPANVVHVVEAEGLLSIRLQWFES